MNTLYEIGALVIVYDPYDHKDIICVVVGIATIEAVEETEDILYRGYCLSYNSPYYFFDSDVVCRIEDH